MNSKGFTLIELVMITVILGILAAVAIPSYQRTLFNAEVRIEKAFANQVWVGLESEAQNRLMEDGTESWPYNPLITIKRTRNIKVNLELGIPNEDNEWQFSLDVDGEPAILHQRPNDEIYYYEYDSTLFYLAEEPILYIAQ
jgi:prepilin-type N-terminal cleavage/methylation domain-containing protein